MITSVQTLDVLAENIQELLGKDLISLPSVKKLQQSTARKNRLGKSQRKESVKEVSVSEKNAGTSFLCVWIKKRIEQKERKTAEKGICAFPLM